MKTLFENRTVLVQINTSNEVFVTSKGNSNTSDTPTKIRITPEYKDKAIKISSFGSTFIPKEGGFVIKSL